MKLRNLFGALVLSLGFFGLNPAHANDFPNKAVNIVVPFSPGGATDILARLLAERMHEKLGQPFVVENKPGAGTMIASNYVKGAKPDGHTILLAASSLGIAPSIYAQVDYDPVEDFEPISQVASVVHILGVHPSVPVDDIHELIDYLKENPDEISYGSVGVGTSTHLEAELFKQMAEVDMLEVPYKGSAPALNDLIAGRIQLMFDAWASTGPFAKDGKVKVLAVTTKEPSPSVPGMPSISEAVPGFAAMPWLGFVAPAGTPKEAIDILYETLQEIIQEEEVQERFQSLGLDVIGNTPEEFAEFIKQDIKTWGNVASTANIRIE